MVSRLIKSGIGPRLRALIPSSSLDRRRGHGVGPRVPVTVLSASVRYGARLLFGVSRVPPSLPPSTPSFPDVRRILRTATDDVALDRRNLCSHCVAGRIEDAVRREGEPGAVNDNNMQHEVWF